MPSYYDYLHSLRAELQPLYDAGEAGTIAKLYLAGVTGMPYATGLNRKDEPLPEEIKARIELDWPDLLAAKPLQYVLGYEEFLGRRFAVNEAVLIPRPETELLVNWAVEEARGDEVVLDAGTGSGCIAASLALALPGAQVLALDKSSEALEVARSNASSLGARVEFLEMDMLAQATWSELPVLDTIVSNPPYVPEAERWGLHPNVCEWEPGLALFVPDGYPLIFYQALAAMGKEKLREGGRIYCELQRDKAEATAAVFREAAYSAELRKDFWGWRMLRAVKD